MNFTVSPAVMVTDDELDQNLIFDAMRMYSPGEISLTKWSPLLSDVVRGDFLRHAHLL